jgi:uncharacterized protein
MTNTDSSFHKLWPHRWISPKISVKPSEICAKGLFANEPIKKGEIIRITGGIIIPKAQAQKYNQLIDYDVAEVYLDISEDFLMAPTQHDLDSTATINHSCSPNAGFLDTITLIAIIDIDIDEEIAWDYAFSQTTFKAFACKCSTRNCRKTITPNDWKIKKIQKAYGEYYSPYLKSKIKSYN